MRTMNLRGNQRFRGVLLLGVLLISGIARGEKPTGEVKLRKGTWSDIQQLIKKNPGKVVIVDAWSTSCAPCMREFPNLVSLHRKYPKEVVCVSFSCDYSGIKGKPPEFYEERVMKFLKSKEATFTNILATQVADDAFAEMKIDSIPAVFVYGPDGKLAQKFDSEYKVASGEEEPFTYKDVGALVEKLIAGSRK